MKQRLNSEPAGRRGCGELGYHLKILKARAKVEEA